MADTEKKKMKAVMNANPLSEMDRKTAEWVRSVPALEKVFKPIVFSEMVELDRRKWSAAKLADALDGLARYDLKILAHRAATHCKTTQKHGPKGQLAAERQLPADYKNTRKELLKKAALAIEEVVSDKGNNRRGLKDGKAALARLDALDARKIFAEPASLAAKAMAKLARALDAGGGDGKAEAKAMTEAAKEMANADKLFEDNAREAQAAVSLIRRVPKSIKEDAAAELRTFAARVTKVDGTLGAFEDAMEKFGKEMDAALAATKAGKPDARAAATLAKALGNSSTETRKAEAVMKELKALEAEFAKLEKLLK